MNTADKYKSTALHKSCAQRKTAVAKLLLESNASVDKQNSEGQTALHIACIEQYEDVVRLLLANGASLEIVDEEKKTPRDHLPKDLHSWFKK